MPQQHYDELLNRLTIIMMNKPQTTIAVENTLKLLSRELRNYNRDQYYLTEMDEQECIARMDNLYNKFRYKLNVNSFPTQ